MAGLGCSDNKSVVVISAPNSPAAPFYFIFFPKDGKYVLVGEGTGAKAVTDRVYGELVRLRDAEIEAMHAAAKAGANR